MFSALVYFPRNQLLGFSKASPTFELFFFFNFWLAEANKKQKQICPKMMYSFSNFSYEMHIFFFFMSVGWGPMSRTPNKHYQINFFISCVFLQGMLIFEINLSNNSSFLLYLLLQHFFPVYKGPNPSAFPQHLPPGSDISKFEASLKLKLRCLAPLLVLSTKSLMQSP